MSAALQPISINSARANRTMEHDLATYKQFHRYLRQTLNPHYYSVFCTIEDHAGPGDGNSPAFTCWASHKTLASEAHTSQMTVRRAIADMTIMGLLEVTEREGDTCLIRPVLGCEQQREYLTAHPVLTDTPISQNRGVVLTEQGGSSHRTINETTLTRPNNETINLTKVKSTTSVGPAKKETKKIKKQGKAPDNKQSDISPDLPAVNLPYHEKWRRKYSDVMAEINAGGDKRKQSGVLAEAWTEITGEPTGDEVYKYVTKLARDYQSGMKVLEAILKMGASGVTDDFRAYVVGVLKNGQSPGQYQRRGSNFSANGQAKQAVPSRTGVGTADPISAIDTNSEYFRAVRENELAKEAAKRAASRPVLSPISGAHGT